MAASQETHPFEYLVSVEHKCLEHHEGLLPIESDVSFSHGLGFQVGSHKYLIPIADVSEVLSVNEYTHIPRSPSWLVGIANVRGNLVTLLDMYDFIFSQSSDAKYTSKRMLLVKQDTHYFGLIIDSIIGMKSFNAENGSDEIPDGFFAEHADHISAFYRSGEEWFAALSINSLLTDKRFTKLHNFA